jgi:hypothetical protein
VSGMKKRVEKSHVSRLMALLQYACVAWLRGVNISRRWSFFSVLTLRTLVIHNEGSLFQMWIPSFSER